MNRTVLVTGGTVRIGLAIAERLRAAGWRVIVSSHRADAGADVVEDLSRPMGAARLYASVMRLLGGVPPDAIVNNAALFVGDDVSVRTVGFDAPQKLTMLMAGREVPGRGVVVNVLDSRVLQRNAGGGGRCPAYMSAKRDLLSYTKKAAMLFADTLRVNAVAPGPVLPPAGVREKAGETPVGRPAPDDVAKAVEFLLDAVATTGCVIPVDGGQSLLEELESASSEVV